MCVCEHAMARSDPGARTRREQAGGPPPGSFHSCSGSTEHARHRLTRSLTVFSWGDRRPTVGCLPVSCIPSDGHPAARGRRRVESHRECLTIFPSSSETAHLLSHSEVAGPGLSGSNPPALWTGGAVNTVSVCAAVLGSVRSEPAPAQAERGSQQRQQMDLFSSRAWEAPAEKWPFLVNPHLRLFFH